jgi:hypothetical protein
MSQTPRWDVFISHASEDKDAIARPIAERLTQAGLSVWIDEQALILGDSLRKKIDDGLARSKWGVVVLSPSFLAKEWPQAELDALLTRELNGTRVLLPVWHDITADDLTAISPLLASRLAIDTKRGLDAVTQAILAAVRSTPADRKDETLAHVPDRTFETLWFASDPYHAAYDAKGAGVALIGATVSQYVLRELLGMGGSGAVFRAHHTPFGRDVALKILFPLQSDHSSITRATERAVRGLGTLRHRNIVTLLDFGYLYYGNRCTAYLAYELVRGHSLSRWAHSIQERNTYLRDFLKVAISIAAALDAAHRCVFTGNLGFQETGVLHGDIKPPNILVEDSTSIPIILDFMIPDLQCLVQNRRQHSSNWKKDPNGLYEYDGPLTGQFGTPGFMAPEQELEGIVTPCSDVYSLGRTLIRSFWAARSEDRFLTLEWIRAKEGGSGVMHQRLYEVLGAMIEAQPGDRPQSMAEVVKRLKDVQDVRAV